MNSSSSDSKSTIPSITHVSTTPILISSLYIAEEIILVQVFMRTPPTLATKRATLLEKNIITTTNLRWIRESDTSASIKTVLPCFLLSKCQNTLTTKAHSAVIVQRRIPKVLRKDLIF